MIKIPLYSDNFKSPYAYINGNRVINTSWAEIIHSAITVGKMNLSDIVKFKFYSFSEIIQRIFTVYSNLKTGKNDFIYRTELFENSDPSEKGVASYLFGMMFAKILCKHFFNIQWLMHLFVYRNYLVPTYHGKSRPDLVGYDKTKGWLIIEGKGRSSYLDEKVISDGKNQVNSLRTIRGLSPFVKIISASYFKTKYLHLRWEDPDNENQFIYDISIQPEMVVNNYYKLIVETVEGFNDSEKIEIQNRSFRIVNFKELGVKIGIDESIYINYMNNQFSSIIDNRLESFEFENGYIGNDGILILLNNNWMKSKMKLEPGVR